MYLKILMALFFLIGDLSAQTHSSNGSPVTHIDDSHAIDQNGTIYYPTGDGTHLAPDGSTITVPRTDQRNSRSASPEISMRGWVIGGPLFYGKPWGPEEDERECYLRSEDGPNCELYRENDRFSHPTMMGLSCSRKIAENETMRHYMNKLCHGRWLPEFRNIKDADADDDGDGVLNKSDFCSGTPPGEKVWRFGEWSGCMGGQRPERAFW